LKQSLFLFRFHLGLSSIAIGLAKHQIAFAFAAILALATIGCRVASGFTFAAIDAFTLHFGGIGSMHGQWCRTKQHGSGGRHRNARKFCGLLHSQTPQ
jgi:hypothetical protein